MEDLLRHGPLMDDPPDLMNDPQFATNAANGEDGMGDADTCRICRGEGSDMEPLFHPCKCSGSIKYVHQDCLMEWLSHSQKKHCELCKTAFRFTKLYSPNMPQTLPIYVLFRHVIIHTIKNITTWLRFCLVVTVWLGFLPYIIRQVWRLLFWFSDGGWPPHYLSIDSTRNSTAMKALEMARELQLATLTGNGTSPVTPFLASQTTSARVGGVMNKLVQFLKPVSQTLNISSADPLAAGLLKSLYYGFGISNAVIPDGSRTNESVSQFLTSHSPASRTPSLLSEIPVLKNLTRNSYVNQLIITIAEGYIITILVVVCFILVFLIREWVVQQQPGINMGAGFNAEFAAPERPREQQALPEPRPLPNGDAQEPRDIGQRPMARPRRRNPHVGDGDDVRHARQNLEAENGPDHRAETESFANRPTSMGDALSPTTEIHKALTEEPRMTEEFLAIWRRADSDPKEVLRIIETENKGDQLRYWVNAMKLLQTPSPDSQALPSPSPDPPAGNVASTSTGIPEVPVINFTTSENSSTDDLGNQPASDESTASSESWIEIPKPVALLHHNSTSVEPDSESSRALEYRPLDKGKSRAVEGPEPSLPHNVSSGKENTRPTLNNPFTSGSTNNLWTSSAAAVSFSSSIPRPRTISDGVQTKENILANNWNFSNLPDDDNVDYKFSWNNGNDTSTESLKTAPGQASSAETAVPETHVYDSQAWKAAQDLRIHQAITKGMEVHKSSLAGHESASRLPMENNDSEAATNEKEKSLDTADEEFAYRPAILDEKVEPSDPDDQSEPDEIAPPTVLPPEVPLPETREPVVAHPAEPQGLLAIITDFLWGGVGEDRPQEEQGANDEHIVQDLAAEAPFVPVVHQDPFDQGGEFAEQDREVVEAAIAAGIDPNDQDAIDDAEDFEGIMELVGMRGPIFSLVQNALFSAFLLALTVAFGIWIPYNIGRVSLLLLANPGPAFKLPLRLIFGLAALMQDLALSLMGVMSWCLIKLFSVPLSMWYSDSESTPGLGIRSAALNVSQSALERVMDGTVKSLVHIGDSEIFAFSAASHESLIYLQNLVIDTLITIGESVSYIFVGDYRVTRVSIWAILVRAFGHGRHFISTMPGFLARSDSWVISLEVGKRTSPLDLELSVWDGTDRFWATIAGYTALSLLGALYVKKGSPFSTGPVGREWEATIIDLLNQAGGVMKVILIISIEMLVFPLYCGLLLDAALLPLFDNTTIISRILFTFKSPLTSIFVHWFVGTCYMFHFALFVSMCRKIMRKGVLCKFVNPSAEFD
jgi:E3 ubiquitin-protein ligase MARCH6